MMFFLILKYLLAEFPMEKYRNAFTFHLVLDVLINTNYITSAESDVLEAVVMNFFMAQNVKFHITYIGDGRQFEANETLLSEFFKSSLRLLITRL